MNSGIKIEGLEELERAFDNLRRAVGEPEQHAISEPAAKYVEMAVKARIPEGPTGNLQRSLVLRKMSSPGTWVVAMDRAVAPHAHLVEYGHGGPQPAPPHPFFRPAIDGAMGAAEGMIEKELVIRIQRAA